MQATFSFPLDVYEFRSFYCNSTFVIVVCFVTGIGPISVFACFSIAATLSVSPVFILLFACGFLCINKRLQHTVSSEVWHIEESRFLRDKDRLDNRPLRTSSVHNVVPGRWNISYYFPCVS